jgi:hypothetical protein
MLYVVAMNKLHVALEDLKACTKVLQVQCCFCSVELSYGQAELADCQCKEQHVAKMQIATTSNTKRDRQPEASACSALLSKPTTASPAQFPFHAASARH